MNRQRGKPKLPAYFWFISYVYVDIDHRSKLDLKLRDASSLGTVQAITTIGFGIQKIERSLEHKDVVFNEKVYKDLLTKSTSENGPGVASRRHSGTVGCCRVEVRRT